MAIGTSFAISRLKKSSIFCISPPRVNICGKIDMMCFDKTGTLTQEGLDVLGFRCSVPEGLPDDSPILEMSSPTLPFGKTCFSQLFKSALQVMPTAIPISSSKTPTGSSFAGSSTSPLPSSILSASLSTAHIDLNDCVPGHPNTPEKPFPYPMILCAMATCHSLKIVQGKLIGDPMDLKMFEFTGWHIEEGEMVGGNHSRRTSAQIDVASLMGTVVRPPSEEDLVNKRMVDTDAHKQQRKRPTSSQRSLKSPTLNDTTMITELCVVRQFEFVSSLRRMSVLVRRIQYPVFKNGFAMGTNNNSAMHPPVTQDLNQDVDIEVFVKGAPEVMKSICIASTIPGNYDDLLKRYAHKGYRILACAYKKYERANYASVSRLSRDEVEQNLLFLGFIIFENKLKPGTTDVIKSLSQSKIRQVMCTGKPKKIKERVAW